MSLPLENRVAGTLLLAFRWSGAFRPERCAAVRQALEGWGKTLRIGRERTGKSPDNAPARVFLRRSGISASRYLPSSEALLRRLLDGETPHSPLGAVDTNNLLSSTIGAPLGLYDASKLAPPFVYRKGEAGEGMETLAKGRFDLDGRAATFDAEGPFGSAVSDSVRSLVAEGTVEWLWVAYGLPGAFTSLEEMLREAIDSNWTRTGELSRACAGGPE